MTGAMRGATPRRWRVTRRAASALVLGASALLLPSRAVAREPLDEDELARVMRGETVLRKETLQDAHGHRFVGGVTYTVIDASPEALAHVFDDLSAYKQILPKTKSARFVGEDGQDAFVELRQGNALGEARYTIRVRKSAPASATREVRFWLDPTRPHGIDDAWGFFRYEQLAPANGSPGKPRALVTFGVLVDLGPGLVRDLFEERVRAMMLSVPDRLHAYVDARPRPAPATALLP